MTGLPPIGSFPRWPQQLELDRHEVQNQPLVCCVGGRSSSPGSSSPALEAEPERKHGLPRLDEAPQGRVTAG